MKTESRTKDEEEKIDEEKEDDEVKFVENKEEKEEPKDCLEKRKHSL